MAIFDRGYRDLIYQPTRVLARIWPIARNELAAMFHIRFGTIVFSACLLPTIGQLIFLLMQAGIWEAAPSGRAGRAMSFSDRMNPSSPSFYLWPITTMSFVPFLVLTTLVSVRAIAKDRAAGALEIYWTRAISPWSYFLGKWYGSFLLLACAFFAAPLVLWITSVLLAPDWSQFETTIGFMPGLLLGLAWMCAMLSLLAVGVSALASTPNLAAILWLFLIMGSMFLSEILRRLLRETWTLAINPWFAGKRVVDQLAGVTPFNDYSPWTALAWISTLAVVVLLFARRRLRVLEAVAT